MSIGASLQWFFRRSTSGAGAKTNEQGEINNDVSSALGLSERLMQQYRETGSDQALSSLYDLHSNKLFHFLVVMSDKQRAEDIVQRSWVKVIEKRQGFSDATNFQAWLFTIGRRLLIDDVRRSSKVIYDSDAIASMTLGNGLGGESSDAASAVDKNDLSILLSTLPYKQKEALSLQLEGFSLEQISTICQIPKETVKTRLRYARDNLKLTVERN